MLTFQRPVYFGLQRALAEAVVEGMVIVGAAQQRGERRFPQHMAADHDATEANAANYLQTLLRLREVSQGMVSGHVVT